MPAFSGFFAPEVRGGKHRFLSAGRAKTRKPPASTPRRASTQAPSPIRTLLQRDEGQRGMGRRAPPPADGWATNDESPMWKPCQCDGVAIANAAAANWELGLKTGNIGTLATLPTPSTVNTSKTGRFVMTTVCKLWSSQNLPLFRIDF